MKTLLLGDVSPTSVTNPLFHNNAIAELFGDTLALFQNIDFCFVNLECALTDSEHAIAKFGPNLKASKNTAHVLKEIGVTCCGLSNNHIFDYGREGYLDTLQALNSAGLMHTGFGADYEDSRKNLFLENQGQKICLITVCEHEYSYALSDRMGSRPFDPYDTMTDLREAKKQSDTVIVIYHGGKEHCLYPSPRLHHLCHAMAENGADIILCQHSHCISCYEQYHDCHILYGQGNFHFVKKVTDQIQDSWDHLLAVKYDTVTKEIEFIPICNHSQGIALCKGEDKEFTMNSFAKRNQSLLDGSWKLHWHDFCLQNKEYYSNAIRDSLNASDSSYGQLFAHYLDCEAHHDVISELFRTKNDTNER